MNLDLFSKLAVADVRLGRDLDGSSDQDVFVSPNVSYQDVSPNR